PPRQPRMRRPAQPRAVQAVAAPRQAAGTGARGGGWVSRDMTRLRSLLREAVDNIRSNRTTTFVALATATFTMLAMGVFLLLYLNVQEALGSLREEIKVIVYLRDAVSPQAVSRVRAEIGQDPAVAGTEY